MSQIGLGVICMVGTKVSGFESKSNSDSKQFQFTEKEIMYLRERRRFIKKFGKPPSNAKMSFILDMSTQSIQKISKGLRNRNLLQVDQDSSLNRRLTEEEGKLVESMIYLAKSILYKSSKSKRFYIEEDEVLSELYYTLVKSVKSYNSDKAKSSTYFWRILHYAISGLRNPKSTLSRRLRMIPRGYEIDLYNVNILESRECNTKEYEELHKALHSLGGRVQQVIRLVFWEKMSIASVAKALCIEKSEALIMLRKGVAKLRILMNA